ncbi:disintegrin and metalloproteinase domain-containing protein 10-like [Artemia franciscana]|uniref:ADAM10 endopeptidase n=1 Tax=Artemia franciscana TaxID=6661 RepID=A0AA88H929_ARTSF|nr:hypothetical protein QYM36_016800 [Artemia franciscana]
MESLHISLLLLKALFLCLEFGQLGQCHKPLSEYVSHFEPLTYDSHAIKKEHSRVRRSANDDHLQLKFHSYGQHFALRLKRDKTVFSENVAVQNHNGTSLEVDLSHFFSGHLEDDPKSTAFGSIKDGVFDGKIITSNDIYYVERSHKYFPGENAKFHSVIYKEADVVDPYENKRTGHVSGCGITDEISHWMDSVQRSGEEEEQNAIETPKKPKLSSSTPKTLEEVWREKVSEDPSYKYTLEANKEESRKILRNKRDTLRGNEKRTCSMFIQTDPYLWKHVYEQEKRDSVRTREEITAMIAQHVKAVNSIYEDTKFDGKHKHRMIRFEVQRIKIDDYEICQPGYSGEESKSSTKFCLPNIDVSNYLNLHSQGNHEDFCLAYVFTYRDFTGGTLGLAWVASASGASGGICERYKSYTESLGGYHRQTKRSLNTGIITFVNYNSRVPPKVSQLTLAHEIGHNFGSPHDYPVSCRPGGQGGNYIMFASATSGDKPNNSKFSICSVGNISQVLDAVHEGKKKNCFSESDGAFCGNKIVEPGEECDCGFDDKECLEDRCCYPRIVSEADLKVNSGAKGCTRRPKAQCSPSEGPCCDKSCRFQPRTAQKCRFETECSQSQYCDGRSAACPPSDPKPDKTECNGNTKVCIKGECTGSMCTKWGMRECLLTSAMVTDKRRLCELACQAGDDNSTCRGTSELAPITHITGGILLRPGSPCDNYQGYCDVFLKCRAVDAEGPLARLKNLLFNRETLMTIAQWVTEYWWAVLLMGIAFVVVMGIFVQCCAVHTPSSNPKRAPALRLTDTLRHPYSTLRRKRPRREGGGLQGRAPPPYGPPGRPPPNGPPHGYGEGRGHYNRPKGTAPTTEWTGPNGSRSGQMEMRPQRK